MKELSLNILDITKNSVKADAKNISISLNENENGILTLEITDDGHGMTSETLNSVTNPFYTTRTTRKVGMGIPLLKLASEQAGGSFNIISRCKEEYPDNSGTTVYATFNTKSIDFTPLGDIVDSLIVLIQGSPDINFSFTHKTPTKEVTLSTAELKNILGEVPLDSFEVLDWIREYLNEQYTA